MRFQSDVKHAIKVIGNEIVKSQDSFLVIKKNGQSIDLIQDNQVAFLKKGMITLHRVDDGMLTNYIKAPAIIGLGHVCDSNLNHFIQCETECSMWVVDSKVMFDIFSEKGLWKNAFFIIRKYLYLFLT